MGNCQAANSSVELPAPKSDFLEETGKRKAFSSSASTATTSTMSVQLETPMKPRLSTSTSLRLVSANEEELGCIRYDCTDLDDAKKQAEIQEKPILCVEARVPGDTKIGDEVLSHPLIVEAAETLFISAAPMECRRRDDPVNVAGATCYTKVRVMDHEGLDLVTPLWGTSLTVSKLASAMVGALNDTEQNVPAYLQLLLEEVEEESCGTREGHGCSFRRPVTRAVFGTSCSKKGELEYASLDGVVATRVGHYSKTEVVEVTYDSSRLSYCNLVRHGLQRDVVTEIFYQANEERVAAKLEVERLGAAKVKIVKFFGAIQPGVDPKHYLRKTLLRFVPLTSLQASKANRLVEMGAFNKAMHLLSPRQGQILMRSMQKTPSRKEVVDVPIGTAWKSVSEDRGDSP